MSNEHTTERRVPDSPVLVAPQEAAVVDGSRVVFRWQAVEDADRYRLEVARDTGFESLVCTEEVTGATELAVTDTFPADEETYYWRVLARNANGWSHGEHVESFVSGTAADADAELAAPAAEEEGGPMPGLVKTASEEVGAELSGHDERARRERERGVAYEGIEAGQIMAIALTILVGIAASIVVLFTWTDITAQAVRDAAVTPGQYSELRQTEAQAAEKLSQYGVVDEASGTYRIPIDRAMDIMANQSYQEGDRSYSPEAPFRPGNQ